MNTEIKTQIVLFSDPNFLAVSLLNTLLNGDNIVYVVTNNKSQWNQNNLLVDKSTLLIVSYKHYLKLSNFDYAVFFGGFLKKKTAMADFKKFIVNKNLKLAKSLAVFPLEASLTESNKKIVVNKSAGIIYVSDLLGPGIDLNSDLLMSTLIREMVEKRTLTLGVGELFSPILVTNASHIISKWLLDPNTYGKEINLIGNQVTSSEFWKQNIKHFTNLIILYDTSIKTRVLPKHNQIKRINSNFHLILNSTYKWIIQNSILVKKNISKVKNKSVAPIKVFPHFKYTRPIVLITFLILIFPLITLLISSFLMFFSYKQFLADNLDSAQKIALVAKTGFVIGGSESKVLDSVPILGKFYNETTYASYLGENLADIFVTTTPGFNTVKTVFNNILGSGVYDLVTPSIQIKSALYYLYQRISFIQVTTNDNANLNGLLAKQVLNLVDFNKLKNLAQQGSYLANNLPSILGVNTNKSYLVLFQNNMELRPTGGFIGSYGTIDFGGGKLNGLTVNDIYSADGQLKGHVEPPTPIKDYLGEANWFFRDSNWNPDFVTSALRAEWFLNKEMEQKVDGTVAIDLTPIKNILNYTGPIFLPDYNLSVTSNNIYEKTQEESQANFFPGSRKKASFLTALSRVLLSEISKMNSKQKLGILKSLYSGFESRDIQVYFHDKDLQDAIDRLSWSGGILNFSCGDACYSDFFADVEANLGVNKSNYFISRKLNFNVAINLQKITRNLNIELSNSANPSLGPSGQYKVYLRTLIPRDSQLVSTKVFSGQSVTDIPNNVTEMSDRQEVGVYVEILPSETKKVNFVWSTDLSKNTKIDSYGLYARKQAGTGNDALEIEIVPPNTNLVTQPVFTLTKAGVYTYNTVLSKDFFARASFK